MEFTKVTLVVFVALLFTGCATGPVKRLSRSEIFGIRANEMHSVRLSPDGKFLAYIGNSFGSARIFVRDLKTRREWTPRTWDYKMSIHLASYEWAKDSRHLLLESDSKGDENVHIFLLNILNNEMLDLTPFEKGNSFLVKLSDQHPTAVLFASNARDPAFFDLYRSDIVARKAQMIWQNKGSTDFWIVDNDLQVRATVRRTGVEGSDQMTWLTSNKSSSKQIQWPVSWSLEERLGFDQENKKMWAIARQENKPAAVVAFEPNSGKLEVIFSHPEHDVVAARLASSVDKVEEIFLRRQGSVPIGASGIYNAHYAFLKQKLGDQFVVSSRDSTGNRWIVRRYSDVTEPSYYLFEPKDFRFTTLTIGNKAKAWEEFQPMEFIDFIARDGLKISGFLTRAKQNSPDRRPPMVLLVHGGPAAQDTWGLDLNVQWLVNRGYSVLQVNYRGSTGYGRAFEEAGHREWGRKVLFDLVDAKNWAVEQRLTNPDTVCIFGYSYGGYAALAGLAFTPAEFKCGVSVNGISDLTQFIASTPTFWNREVQKKKSGDPQKDRELQIAMSPSYHAEKIQRPVLLIHMENDTRVNKIQSDLMFSALNKLNKPVQYLVFPDGGHGLTTNHFWRHLAAIEDFFKENLGGYAEAPNQGEFWDDYLQPKEPNQ